MSDVQELLQENEPDAPVEKVVKAAPRMCKGQMPSPLVWYVKFHESKENRSAIAAKYFTTSGKVTDIQTNSNQKYIEENMVFSDEELDQAVVKIKENFVRGQEEQANGGAVSARQLATTQPGDEAYSLEVVELIREAGSEEGAVSLESARAAYNEANPRKKPEPKAEQVGAVDDSADDGEDLDDLLVG